MKEKTLYKKENKFTYGQKYLLDLDYKRQLSQFLREKLDNKYTLMYMSKLATAKLKTPSIRFILDIKDVIPPADWFHTLEEPRPRRISKNREYVKNVRESINFKYIMDLFNERKLLRWCADKNIKCNALYHVINGRSEISTAVILKLKDYLKPINWFVKGQ